MTEWSSWPPPPGVYLAPPKGYPLVKTGLVVFWLCFGCCLGSGGRACVGLDGWMDWQLSTGCGGRRRFQMLPLLADIRCIGMRVANERTTMSNEEKLSSLPVQELPAVGGCLTTHPIDCSLPLGFEACFWKNQGMGGGTHLPKVYLAAIMPRTHAIIRYRSQRPASSIP